MLILSIETSCDDTSLALVEASQKKGQKIPEFKVIKNLVSSQTAIHSHWGGVVPSLAKREHLKNLPLIWRQIVRSQKTEVRAIRPRSSVLGHPLFVDLISVTTGPGLEPSLWTGIEFAKKLSKELKIPLVGANHLEGHLYSFLLPKDVGSRKSEVGGSSDLGHPPLRPVQTPPSLRGTPKQSLVPSSKFQVPCFPAISLLVSGGHTILTLMKDLTHWEKLGETRDDAVGEAYDKVAKMMGLPYPGGPEIEKLAAQGDPNAINFPRPMIHPVRNSPPRRPFGRASAGAISNGVHSNNYEFSFSGLKTAVLYYLRQLPTTNYQLQTNIAASFQSAAVDVLVKKTMRAVRAFGAKSVFLCGGVAANKTLRSELEKNSEQNGAQFFAPDFEYNTDNAAMIAVAAYMRKKSRKKSYPIEANPNLSL